MQVQDPVSTYRQLKEKNEALLQSQQQRRSRLGWARFIVFVLTAALTYFTFVNLGLWGIAVVVTGLALLLFLISRDVANNEGIANTKRLVAVNEEELRILGGGFHDRWDGQAFLPDVHPYAHDLDLFGKASLFQWMNRCYTEGGRSLMASNLLEPLEVQAVLERQAAVSELAGESEWRQQFQAYAAQQPITKSTQRKTEAWLEEPEKHFVSRGWKPAVLLYSAITLTTLAAAVFDYISFSAFGALYTLYILISLFLSRNTVRPYIHLSGIVKEIGTLYQLVKWTESKTFGAPLLKRMQESMTADGKGAASEIRRLKVILDRFDLRISILGFLFFNPFLLWDVRQMIALNHWRGKNKALVPHWFEAIAGMEVLHSLATLRFNQPEWVWPQFTPEHFHFSGRAIGHPLLPAASRVTNDFSMDGPPEVALITGSNMAGKSTFLRSLGVNAVLAQVGAPVCAAAFSLSPVRLMSSMRIADNLAENTSTFYAELKKLKTIIEAVRRKEKIFILLDEILRGTNSLDRHTGSEALIRQLIREDAVAVIATHDVELARLEGNLGEAVVNYHFDVQVEGEELYFDYKLKHGVCTSLNASILMKKIGIEL